MTLQLGVMTATGWATLRPLWQALGWDEQGSDSIDTWYLKPDAHAADRALLVHARAEFIIARLMQEGMPPQQALAVWKEQAEGLLRYFKAHRQIACVVDIHELSSHQAVDTLCRHSGLFLPESLPDWHPVDVPLEEYLLIATQLLRQGPEFAPLLGQLEACTLPLSDACLQSPAIDVSGVLERLTRLQRDHKRLHDSLAQAQRQQSTLAAREQQGRREYDDLLEEKKLLLEQLQGVQEALAEQCEACSQLERQLESLQAEQQRQVAALKLEIAQCNQKYQVQAEEARAEALKARELASNTRGLEISVEALERDKQQLNQALLQARGKERDLQHQHAEWQRHQAAMQEQLNTRERDLQALQKEKRKLEEQLGVAQERQSALEEKQQRSVKELSEQQDINRLVMGQLQSVQEAYEVQVIKRQHLEANLQAQSQAQEHALAVANQKAQHLQEALNRLKSSATWKAGAPVRALGKPFRRQTPDKRRLKRQARQLTASPYFDAHWYLAAYPDVAEHGMDPAYHYLVFGADEGRNPSERFDTLWYLQTNPDVEEGGLNPLIHFLNHGQAEGRAPNSHSQAALPAPKEVN